MGYLDKTGEWAVRPKFSHALPFSEGRAIVSDGSRTAAIDRDGEVVVPWFEGLMYSFSQGLACVIPGGSIRMGLAGRIRQKLFGGSADDLYPAAWWHLRGKVGFADQTGRMVIPPRFEPKLNFVTAGCGFSSSGYAAMRQDGKEGVIDTRGEWVVEPRYDYIGMVFSGNRKVVALIAERVVKPGIFLDTVERIDGSMVPGQPASWRGAGYTQEVMISGGLMRALLNHVMFPKWQRDLLNDDVSSRTLAAWLSSLVFGIATAIVILKMFARGPGVLRTFGATVGGIFAVALSFVAGLLSLYFTAGLGVLAAGMAARKWQAKRFRKQTF